MKFLLENRKTKRILMFVILNFSFIFVELFYGWKSNSLGLISDSFHMLFDCIILVISLVIYIVSNLEPGPQFPFGYGKVDVLAGFCSGTLLLFTAFNILLTSIDRIMNPLIVESHEALTVSIIGLLVNIFGLLAFHDVHEESHHHAHDESSCCESVSCSPKDSLKCNHSHSIQQKNRNKYLFSGMFLHVLADALGSVFVIISNWLIGVTGWNFIDPVCSIILSLLIFISVLPLLKKTSSNLLLQVPSTLTKELPGVYLSLNSIEGVLSCDTIKILDKNSGNYELFLKMKCRLESQNDVRERALKVIRAKLLIEKITLDLESIKTE
ncbi:cation efflux protein [Rozella allomycis CSF55]|uniref:Cation efflux protein n=1 Tax=Rozella allomycis (strain CSF55) TaxID=988480 RepID=A0A4P9YIP3_ROZAC|nr:cation efflux protein [Rozella allomycis CSF55]